MTQHIVMPKLGLTMTEAEIIEWVKQEGETVHKGEVLFTFESDKATLEFEAPASGTLHILVPAGERVPVMTPVAKLHGAPAAAATSQAQPLRASPKARALARERSIALAGVNGTGPRGMIVAADVPAGAETPTPKASPVARRVADETGIDLATVGGTGPRGRVMRVDVERLPAEQPTALTGLRGIIAERLVQSWRQSPHVTLTTDADATNLVAARRQAAAELGEKVAYDALLMMLAARALREHPYMNATLTDDGIQTLEHIHIGAAVDTPRGLLVPVVHDADTKRLPAINHELREKAQRAIEGRSLPDELTGGTFTITNLGMFGIDAFTPVINPPECAILGVGRIVARPVGVGGQVVLREMMALSLSIDHRLVDGAPAARFLARVRQLIEQPFILALVE